MPSSASPPPETYTLSLHDALPISLASEGATLDRLFIQVGGAALASAVIASFVEAQRLGAIERLPRFHTVQTRGGFPLQRAYELLVERIGISDPDELAERFTDAVQDWLAYAGHHRSEF